MEKKQQHRKKRNNRNKKASQPISENFKCNICKLPAVIEYKEWDSEGNTYVIKKHTVDCPGHPGIHGALWNRHPEYDKYRMLRLKQQENSGANHGE